MTATQCDSPLDAIDRLNEEVDRLRRELADCRATLKMTETEECRRLKAEVERLRRESPTFPPTDPETPSKEFGRSPPASAGGM